MLSGILDSLGVAIATVLFEVGSRTDDRDTFATKTIRGFRPPGQPIGCSNSLPSEFVRGQKKVSKEKAARMPLVPCGAPIGLLTRHIHVPRPSGAAHANRLSRRFVRLNPPVLGAAYGRKPRSEV